MHHYSQISVVQSFKLKPKNRFAGDLYLGGLVVWALASFVPERPRQLLLRETTFLADSASRNITYIGHPDIDDVLKIMYIYFAALFSFSCLALRTARSIDIPCPIGTKDRL